MATLRDYLAAQAMTGMLAHSTRYKPRDPAMAWHQAISQESYEIADAMLSAREAKHATHSQQDRGTP